MMASSESEHRPDPRTRVAVVGTGLAGLTTAYLLRSDQKRRYAVTLFEQADSLAFDSASVTIKNETTDVVERLDLPMRASAGGYYSNLLRMYHHLRVPLHPIRFLFVFAKALSTTTDGTARPRTSRDAANETYFVHASNLHQTPPPWPGNRGFIPHIIEILYLIVCQFWFTLACFLVSPLDEDASATGSCESLAEYLERIRLPRRYASHYVVPLMSSVSTCSHEEMLAFPASDIVNYKKLSHGQQHYTICGGVSQVESRLAVGLEDVRVNSRVMEVMPSSDGTEVTVRWQSTVDGSGHINEQVFDRVVLSVSPDVAGKIFRPVRSMVERLPTRRVESSVLRPEEMEGQSVVRVADGSDAETAACAHHLANAPPSQVITLRTLFPATGNVRTEALHTMPSGVVVSTCPLEEDADSKAILKKAKFTRTLRSTKGRAVVQQLMGESRSPKKAQDEVVTAWVNGQDNVWLVGAWCWDGMVLLEGCIVSAMRVASDFGVRIPWE
ncbi:hypothetical protein FALBO_15771 [Fusarium albosuccineum]|uniref:Amine oxidase domain-containing protein n=1 Tax=Fusarium albosuccineum TaxID=1237068 RepID=A0A8H4KNY1_9HYPO|nr:hypothetical protein FALBO_15771 [Fusarium albosuccineum]